MEKLLQWGIKNSDPEKLSNIDENKMKELDPEVIDAILGKDEATMMKENMQVILNEEAGLEDRETAFDNMEMFVEHIDNAKNLTPLNMWQPLIELLHHKEASLRKYAAWVLGTATQNNPVAQSDFIKNNGFENLIKALENEKITGNSNKLIYCLSCATRHHNEALNKFQTLNGFETLYSIISNPDTDATVISRVIFMLNSLIVDEPNIITPILNSKLFARLFEYLTNVRYFDNEDLMQKGLQLLYTATPTLKNINAFDFKNIANNIDDLELKFKDALSEAEWQQLKQLIK